MAAVVANVVMSLMGRVVVNLNYTCSSETLNYCLEQCKIRHVLTSRRFLEKLDLKLDAELVFLEDFKDRATLWDKLAGWVEAHLPLGMLERRLGIDRHEARRSADGDFHLGLDRPAEGGDAQLSQHGGERPGDRRGGAAFAERRAAGHFADVSLLRLHGQFVVGAGARHQGGLSLQPARGAADRQAVPQT